MARSDVPRQRRSDAERSRRAVLEVAARELSAGPSLDMSRLAEAAGISRSTLYRHFANGDAVRAALVDVALEEAVVAVGAAVGADRPPLALLRRAVEALVGVGTKYVLDRVAGDDLEGRLDELSPALAPLVRGVWDVAELSPPPPADLERSAAAHLALAALRSWAPERDASSAADDLFVKLTEPLDQCLVVLRADGSALAANPQSLAALGLESLPDGPLTSPAAEPLYEDGSPCPPSAYPLARAVDSGESQTGVVRGHVLGENTRWFTVSAAALRIGTGGQPYAIVGVLSDVTAEKDAEARHLQPPGTLGRERAVPIDVARVLDKVPARLLPEQLVAEARRLVEVPVTLYVVDIDGTHLLRLAGVEEFPARIKAPLALGPELAEDGIPDLSRWVADELPGVVMAPMWLRGRAVGVLLAAGGDQAVLDEVARQAAPAMELANGYTDVFDAARRRKEINPAAEIQQSLMPPRIVRLAGGQIACGVLPSYDVGGDWVDYVDNRDGAWLAIADASGRGPRAAALGSIALAALRSARRNDQGLEEAVETMHETMCEAGTDDFFVTAVVARWSPVYSVFSWLNAGHPAPLLLHADGSAEDLDSEPDLPLGMFERDRPYRRSYRRLAADDRVILFTDGVSARPTKDGFFGRDGIAEAARSAQGTSASAIARAIQEAVAGASEKPLRDDAAVTVLAPAPIG